VTQRIDPKMWSREAIEARFADVLGQPGDTSREAKRRRAILMAGYQLFLHHGYKKTTIDDVAKKAHVAKGTVYLYFKNKAELLVTCVAHEKQALKDEIGKIFAPETHDRDRLRLWLKMSLYAVRDMPLSSRLMTGDLEMWDALDDAKSAQYDKMRAEGGALCMHFIELAAPGAFDEAEKRRRADVLISMGFLSGMFLDPRMRNDMSLDAFLETLMEMLLAGATHRRPSAP
jgi:AcrR family transcriptional regulator